MDYGHLPTPEKRAICQGRIAALEAEHYEITLDRQPVRDKERLEALELRIVALRAELASLPGGG